MTRDDFNLILIEAMEHVPVDEFFKARERLAERENGYSREGFIKGLLNAFKLLNLMACMPVPEFFRLETQEDELIEGLFTFDNYSEQRKALEQFGKLKNPCPKPIEVRTESDNRLLCRLSRGFISLLWPHLYSYINPGYEDGDPLPPPPLVAPLNKFHGVTEVILVPDSVAKAFKTRRIDNYLGLNDDEPESGIDEKIIAKLPSDGIQYLMACSMKFTPTSRLRNYWAVMEILNSSEHPGSGLKKKKESLPALTAHEEVADKNELTQKKGKQAKKGLTIDQQALIFVYEGISVTRENCREKVEKTGHKSGEKLYQRYCCLSSSVDRRARPETDRKLKNKIKLFESIRDLLSEKGRERAENDLQRLRGYLEN